MNMSLTIFFLCPFLCLFIVETLHKACHQFVTHCLRDKGRDCCLSSHHEVHHITAVDVSIFIHTWSCVKSPTSLIWMLG